MGTFIGETRQAVRTRGPAQLVVHPVLDYPPQEARRALDRRDSNHSSRSNVCRSVS